MKPALGGIGVGRNLVFSRTSLQSRLSRLQVAALNGTFLERKNISVPCDFVIDGFHCSNKTDGGQE